MLNFNLSEIINVITTLIAGGGAGWILKSKRRSDNAAADKAEVEAREAEFELLRKQIDLNHKQNLDLIEQLSRKEDRFADQTTRLRKVQQELTATTQQILELTRTNADLQRANDYLHLWHCREAECTTRRPTCPILTGQQFQDPQP